MKFEKALRLSRQYNHVSLHQHHAKLSSIDRARSFSHHAVNRSQGKREKEGEEQEETQGAMSRRLAAMTDDAITSSKAARKNVQNAGFSDELKKQLEEKIAASSFKSDNAAAFSIANMPRSADKVARDTAASAPWTGNESIHDSALRMLNDASKPMRVPFKPPQPSTVVPPPSMSKRSASSGQRLASAREQTNNYAMSHDKNLSQSERDAFRSEVRERFGAGVQSVPVSIQGLNSLANERIEDAMAQGQFKNIKRGKGKNVERDHLADTPYLDTTEYFMNRILKQQETAPGWIQKQQEMKLEVDRFRTELRIGWRRRAATLISSQGGTLQTKIRRAQAYAAAETRLNRSSQSSNKTGTNGEAVDDGRITKATSSEQSQASTTGSASSVNEGPLPDLPRLRDPEHFAIEREYHQLKIKKLNDIVRSYNLQAPQISQRPYLDLQRELESCYADVAPTLPEELQIRATQKTYDTRQTAEAASSILQSTLGLKHKARVYDEDTSKGYGFKQLWQDLWGKKERSHIG